MIPKVYTPAEVAEVLRVSQEDALKLISNGELSAFLVLGKPRVTEQALDELMNRPYHSGNGRLSKKTKGKRNRNSALEKAYAKKVKARIVKETGADLRLVTGRKYFRANGKQVILMIATTPSGIAGEYWFGFKEEFLRNRCPTFLVLGVADRDDDLVIPCERFKAFIDGLSVDGVGEKKLHVATKGGLYYLPGKGIEQPIPLDSYVNAFHLLR